jgi:hypothetical protein
MRGFRFIGYLTSKKKFHCFFWTRHSVLQEVVVGKAQASCGLVRGEGPTGEMHQVSARRCQWEVLSEIFGESGYFEHEHPPWKYDTGEVKQVKCRSKKTRKE